MNVCNSRRKNCSEVKPQCTHDHRWKWNEIAESTFSLLDPNDVCNKSMFLNFCWLTIKSCKEQNINEIMVNKSSKTNIPNWGNLESAGLEFWKRKLTFHFQLNYEHVFHCLFVWVSISMIFNGISNGFKLFLFFHVAWAELLCSLSEFSFKRWMLKRFSMWRIFLRMSILVIPWLSMCGTTWM